MGCCISPRDASPIEGVAVSIRDQPYGDDLLVVGNLNSNIAEPEGTPWGGAIVDELAAAELKDMVLHFLPRCKPWLQDMCMWHMRRDGQEVRSHMDYILVTDIRLFQDVTVWYLQHNLDHYMVPGCLRGEPAKELTDYLREAPLPPPDHPPQPCVFIRQALFRAQ